MTSASLKNGGSNQADKGDENKLSKDPNATDDNCDDDNFDEGPSVGLLNRRSLRVRDDAFDPLSASYHSKSPREWQRKYWLGFSLCLILFSFWMLDSLKDPIFGHLVNGNLKLHQPIAKLVSVATTLALVIFLEFLSNARKERQRQAESRQHHTNESVLDEGGFWSKMGFKDDEVSPDEQNKHAESSSLVYVLVSYVIAFLVIARILQYHPRYTNKGESTTEIDEKEFTNWHIVGYIVYATIESFGSLAVASFWSFTNTTLSLEDAERYYGPIIAIAQLGAIGGATMVTAKYSDTELIILACLIIILHLVVMSLYTHRFRPTNIQAIVASEEDLEEFSHSFSGSISALSPAKRHSQKANTTIATSEEHSLWSGIHLILRHNYVLLLLGVSCLYEVSLTCLDYQMKLIGYNRFETNAKDTGISFTEFMGHYGQLVNASSLVLSLVGFPFLISRLGLRYTLRLFPTLLLVVTAVAYGALPGNLYVLFISIAILKATTYSIHDPSKELLYLPTSNAIKFKAKFWIDVVGARVAKAIGSTINTYAGNVDRSVRVGTIPSLLTAALLWAACYCAGVDFDHLIESGTIVGLDHSEMPTVMDDGIHSGIYMHDGDDDDREMSELVPGGDEGGNSIELHEVRTTL